MWHLAGAVLIAAIFGRRDPLTRPQPAFDITATIDGVRTRVTGGSVARVVVNGREYFIDKDGRELTRAQALERLRAEGLTHFEEPTP